MFGNRRSEYEEEGPVYPSEGYGREQGGPGMFGPPGGEGVYGEDRVPYERPEYVGEGRREEQLYERERREEGYGQPGYGAGGGEYGREGYGGYGGAPPPRGEYFEQGGSDLGMGARDSGISGGPDYGAGYGTGYGRPMGNYGGQEEAEIQRLQQEVATEKRREREAEVAAAGGVGFGLFERHEKNQEEEGTGYNGEKKHHGFFGL